MTEGKPYIMVVDDDADFVEMTRSLLERAGYEVGVAYSGKECMEKVGVRKPDLILLDIMMSTFCEGMDVAERLRDGAETGEIAVMLVSSMDLNPAFVAEPELAHLLPAKAYLAKPLKPDELLHQVGRCLRARRPAAEAAPREEPDRPTVLLVDDDADYLEMTTSVLEGGGYRVLTALNAAEARERMAERAPDVIVTDLMMESLLAGFLFTQQIRHVPHFRRIPIVFVSNIRRQEGVKFRGDPRELAAVGVDGYFDKPVRPEALLAKVGELLARRHEGR